MSDRWMTFDCFGTLLDWQGAFRRLLDPRVVDEFHHVEREVQRELPTASYKDILRECTTRAARRAGVEADAEALVEGWHTIEAFPDTLAALEYLHEEGWKLGILTNCDDDLFASTLPALGVTPDLVVTAEQVHSYKPALGHFERFETESKTERANWVHAAVSWFHDMVPAHDLGLRTVWVDREDTGHDASIVTHRVTDMAGLAGIAGELR